MTEPERIDGRIRDLAELCTRHGTPCADGLLAEIGRLRTDLVRLVGERDKAREECGHAKAMRQGVSEELSRFVRLKIDADAELAATEGDLGVAIREAAAARDALKLVRPMLESAHVTRLLNVVDAALDQRLTQ